MDPIEQSVRRALEGGDPANHAFRRSIYAASLRATERMAVSRQLSAQALEHERERVAEVVTRIESEYASYYGSDDAHLPADPSGPDAAPFHAETAPPVERRAPASYGAAAAAPAPQPSSEGEVWRPGAKGPSGRRKGGRPLVWLGALVLVLGVIVVVAFWSRSAPSTETTSEAPAAEGAVRADAQPAALDPLAWIDVFSGANIDQVGSASGARVSSVEAEGRNAIRISGPQGSEGEVTINLGAGLVQRIAGSDVRVEIVAGSPDGGAREFSVRCVFGEASVCDRQRFATAMPEEAFVFDVAIPGEASAPANLAIGPALTASGPDVDIYSVRMRVL